MAECCWVHWRRGERVWGGEQDQIAKPFVRPDGEAELHSGTMGKLGCVAGKGGAGVTYMGKSWEVDTTGFAV